MEQKDFPVEIKELNDKGEGVLRFIRFHQEDKDADITLPGFIGEQEAPLLVAHNWTSDHPPLGHGKSFEADGATNFSFQLNMDDPRAKTWHSWLKMDQRSMRPIQQVSYGFRPYDDGFERGHKDGKPVRFLKPRKDGSPGAKLFEVSFVVVGSGNDTGVLDIKRADGILTPEEKQEGVTIQTLIFSKEKWNDAAAVRAWLRSHDFASTLDETDSSWRAQQRPPGDFVRLRTFCINPSRDSSAEECRVQAVGGPLKESSSLSQETTERKRPIVKDVLNDLDSLLAHFTYLHHVRAKNGKHLAQDTLDELDALTQKVVAFRVLLNLKAIEAQNPVATIYHDREKLLREEAQARDAAAKAEQQAAIAALVQSFQTRQAFIEQQKSRV
jgi:hypothetical protein